MGELQRIVAQSPELVTRSMRAMREEYPNEFGELKASAISLSASHDYPLSEPLPFRRAEEPYDCQVFFCDLTPKVDG